MTPKEKSKQLLFEKYAWIIYSMDKYHARKCALIAVDEIISILDNEGYDESDWKLKFWIEVKQELQNMQ